MNDLDALFADFVVEVSISISAPPEAVWDLVSDIASMAAFSPEVLKTWWHEDGPHAPVVGARFSGTNRLADFEWTRVCTVVASERPAVFAYTVGDRFDGSPSGTWTFRCTPEGDTTLLTQYFAHEPVGRSGTRLLAEQDPTRARSIIATRSEIIEGGMTTTLQAIRNVIERG
jgi:uncharacterized protein YndB with AHSA1/START domain